MSLSVPPRVKDITGQTFGRWTVEAFAGRFLRGGQIRTFWRCKCACGVTRDVDGSHLKMGDTLSCGCWNREATIRRMTRHGRQRSAIYGIWRAMISRCTNPNCASWKHYGARGITVCDRWSQSFIAFLQDMGERPSSRHSIDRIDPTKGYEPGNCRWATIKTQARNRRSNRLITFDGKTMTLIEWAEQIGIGHSTIAARLDKLRWNVAKALTAPPISRRPRKSKPAMQEAA